jgi:hypothetical protein
VALAIYLVVISLWIVPDGRMVRDAADKD